MLSSHLSIGLPIGLFHFIFDFFTTSTLTLPLPHDIAKTSKFVPIDHLNNGQHITIFA